MSIRTPPPISFYHGPDFERGEGYVISWCWGRLDPSEWKEGCYVYRKFLTFRFNKPFQIRFKKPFEIQLDL